MNTKWNSNSIQSSSGYTITVHVFPFHSKKRYQSPPPPPQHQPWSVFLGTQRLVVLSRNSASIHSGLPGKPHQDAKTCSFSQVLGSSLCEDGTEPNLITGQCGIASSRGWFWVNHWGTSRISMKLRPRLLSPKCVKHVRYCFQKQPRCMSNVTGMALWRHFKEVLASLERPFLNQSS